MSCVKNRIYYHDNVMKKDCCSCKNLELVFYTSKLAFNSDVGVQRDFSEKQTSSRKQNNNFKNIDPIFLVEHLGNFCSGCYNGDQSIAEAGAILGELGRVGAITCEQYKIFLGNCLVKGEQK